MVSTDGEAAAPTSDREIIKVFDAPRELVFEV
jgi:hypothetical protein